MKFGIISTSWGDDPDIEKMFSEIKESGWDGCEIRLSLDWMGPAHRMKKLANETNCRMFCLATETGPVDSNDRAMLFIMRRIEYAAAMGVRNVMIFPPPRPPWRSPTTSEYNNFAEAAERLAEYGSEFGIALSFHHHTDYLVERIDEAEGILKQTRHLKLCLDSYHTTILGDDFIDAYRSWRDRIHFVHIHDGRGIKLLDLGEGSIPILPVLEELSGSGFDGWVITHGGATDRTPFEKSKICRNHLRALGF